MNKYILLIVVSLFSSVCFFCYQWGKSQARVEIVEKTIEVYNECEVKYVKEIKKLDDTTVDKEPYRVWADTPVDTSAINWLQQLKRYE